MLESAHEEGVRYYRFTGYVGISSHIIFGWPQENGCVELSGAFDGDGIGGPGLLCPDDNGIFQEDKEWGRQARGSVLS